MNDGPTVAVATLADLLRETAEHHGSFEQSTPKHNWWDWYAPYLNAREHGNTPDQAEVIADDYMRDVHGIVRANGPNG